MPPTKNTLNVPYAVEIEIFGLHIYTHVEIENSPSCRARELKISCRVLATIPVGKKQSINEKENAVLIQTDLRFYRRACRSWKQKLVLVSSFWSIAWAMQTQTCPVLSDERRRVFVTRLRHLFVMYTVATLNWKIWL